MPSKGLMTPYSHLFGSKRWPIISAYTDIRATKVADTNIKTVVTAL